MADSAARRWIGFRPEIRIIDCTIRDGGLMNDHFFEDSTVRRIVQGCADGGIDFMEIGYKGSKGLYKPGTVGPWRFCEEDDMNRVIDGLDLKGLKLSAMADVGRTEASDLLPKSQSPLSLIRVACYIHQVPGALDIIKAAHDKGYETAFNLMALSSAPLDEVENALELVVQSEVNAIYVVDSFGSFYGEQVREHVQRFLKFAAPMGKTVGIHAHNNQQMAFANSIETIVAGGNMVDGSLAGLGRGAGNCPTEFLAGFLHNPKYRLRPLLETIRDAVEPLRAKIQWGPSIPYFLSGLLNRHPREAMAFESGTSTEDIVSFYDRISM